MNRRLQFSVVAADHSSIIAQLVGKHRETDACFLLSVGELGRLSEDTSPNGTCFLLSTVSICLIFTGTLRSFMFSSALEPFSCHFDPWCSALHLTATQVFIK